VVVRILFLVPYTPTPIRTRPYNLLRGLAGRGHDLTLATLWQSEDEREVLRQWERMGVRIVASHLSKGRSLWNLAGALPGTAPLQASYCWHPALVHQLEAEPGLIDPQPAAGRLPFDIVHVEHLRGARYALWLKDYLGAALDPGIPVVWDSVDCISYLFEQAAHTSASMGSRLMTQLDLQRTRRYEAWLAGQFDQVLVTSAVDKAAFERIAQSTPEHAGGNPLEGASSPQPKRVLVLCNGVDLEHFQPGPWPRQPDGLVFSGKMSYHANVTAALHLARDIMPLVWRRRPQATLTIVGHNPPAAVRGLAGDARIVVTGSVGDVRPYLQRAAAAMAPMPYGAGIQNKVLEAMACATPVVASPQATAALQTVAGEHLLLAGSAGECAKAVLRLLDDTDLQQRIGHAGRRYVEERHNWDDVVARLESVYTAVMARGRGVANG
jgi:polysaccharide biosynthesis protein PslH